MIDIIFHAANISDVVEKYLNPLLQKYSILVFKGPLGAGKTTIIKKLLTACGVTDVITSPTFTYVNSYENTDGKVFNHFDLYRITTIDGFFELGFDEYLYRKDEISCIEWPEIIEPFLNELGICEYVCVIDLEYMAENEEERRLIICPLKEDVNLK